MFKRLSMLAVLVLLLFSLAATYADSTKSAHCGDLSAADCQIIEDNLAVMDALRSLAFALDMTSASGDSNMTATGSGAFAISEAAYAEMMTLSETMSPEAANALLEILLTSMNGEFQLHLQGTEAGEETDSELRMLLKDGVLLLNVGTLEALLGEPMTGVDWLGFDMNDALGEMLADSLPPMMNGDSLALTEAEQSTMTITRLPDSELNGVAVAVFESSIDMNALLAQQDMSAMADDPNQAMLLELMQGLEFQAMTAKQYIGLADHYTHGMDLSLQMSYPNEEGAIVNTALDLSLTLSAFDEPVEVELPEDAMVLPLAMMMQMGNS